MTTSLLLAQAVLPNTIIQGWTEAKSISVVLSILTLVLFYICWYIFKLYIRKTDELQKTVLELQVIHEKSQLTAQQANTALLKEVTTAITELATLFKERGVTE